MKKENLNIRGNIMVVDDDINLRTVFADFLSLNRFKVYTAHNGKECLVFLSELRSKGIKLDFVILDLEMPVMGGIETLRIIRKKMGNLPVFIATGIKEESIVIETMTLGCEGFILKPYKLSKVLERINDFYNTKKIFMNIADEYTRVILKKKFEDKKVRLFIKKGYTTDLSMIVKFQLSCTILHYKTISKEDIKKLDNLPNEILQNLFFIFIIDNFNKSIEKQLNQIGIKNLMLVNNDPEDIFSVVAVNLGFGNLVSSSKQKHSPQKQIKRVCPDCNTILPDGEKFCPACGFEFENEEFNISQNITPDNSDNKPDPTNNTKNKSKSKLLSKLLKKKKRQLDE